MLFLTALCKQEAKVNFLQINVKENRVHLLQHLVIIVNDEY